MGAPLTLSRHKLYIDDYHRMGHAGILREDSRVELVEGELIDMAPIGSLHLSVVTKLSMLLARQVGDFALVSTQNPLSLPPDSEPQPDIALLKPRADWYSNALPGAQDVLLLIEVGDSSAEYDREIKIPLYARHVIPEAWLIDLRARTLHIYREPHDAGYRRVLQPEPGETASPLLLSSARIVLAEILAGVAPMRSDFSPP